MTQSPALACLAGNGVHWDSFYIAAGDKGPHGGLLTFLPYLLYCHQQKQPLCKTKPSPLLCCLPHSFNPLGFS